MISSFQKVVSRNLKSRIVVGRSYLVSKERPLLPVLRWTLVDLWIPSVALVGATVDAVGRHLAVRTHRRQVIASSG